MRVAIKILFTVFFVMSVIYIFFYETERYESHAVVALKDLSKKQPMSSIDSILLMGNTEESKPSKLLELYIKSHEMYDFLEYKFRLSQYYSSDKIDILHRLYKDTKFKFFQANKENFLKKYNEDLIIRYDEPTGTLSIDYANADQNYSKVILQAIIDRSKDVINQFEKENAKVALGYMEKQVSENKTKFIKSIKEMMMYQNKHLTIDPNVDLQTQSTIIANLESELMQKEVEYNSKIKFFNTNTYEMKLLEDTISSIKKNIDRVKHKMTGKSDEERKLSGNVFVYELIKNEMEFNKEIYKQSLINREELKIEVSQNAKNLLTITTPIVSESYTYPSKYRDTFTVLLMLFFLYGIITTILTILKDHRD